MIMIQGVILMRDLPRKKLAQCLRFDLPSRSVIFLRCNVLAYHDYRLLQRQRDGVFAMYMYIYIHTCMHACIKVCARTRECARETERDRETEMDSKG
jgi:hypothetical protein